MTNGNNPAGGTAFDYAVNAASKRDLELVAHYVKWLESRVTKLEATLGISAPERPPAFKRLP
jgi:hypothetical protein